MMPKQTTLMGRLARATTPAMLLLAAPAFAQMDRSIEVNAAMRGAETRSQSVRVAAFDRDDAQARRRLDTRLRVAAGAVCGKFSEPGVRMPADYVRCYDAALSSARSQADTQMAMAGGVIRIGAK